nr:hypothetical protein HmN_000604500 [Hymenolepis microstoma]
MHSPPNDSPNRRNFQGDNTEFSQKQSEFSEGKSDHKQHGYNIRYVELTRRMFELKIQDATKSKHPIVRKRIPSEAIQVIKSNIPNSVSTPAPSCRLVKRTPKLKHGENPVVVSTNYNSSYHQPATRQPRYVIRSKEEPQIKAKTNQGNKLTRTNFQALSAPQSLHKVPGKSVSTQRITIDSKRAKVRLHHKGYDIEINPKNHRNYQLRSQSNSPMSLTTFTQSSITRTPKIQIDPPSSTQSLSIPNVEPAHPVSDDLSSAFEDSDTMTPIDDNDKTITSPSMSVNTSQRGMNLLEVPYFKIESEISTPRRSAYVKPGDTRVHKKARLSIIIPSEVMSTSNKDSLPQNLNISIDSLSDEPPSSISSSSIPTPALNDEDLFSDLGSSACDDQLTDVFDVSDGFNSPCPENIEKLIQVCAQNTVALVPSCLSPISERSLLSHDSNQRHADTANLNANTQIGSLLSNSRRATPAGVGVGSGVRNEVPANGSVMENSRHSNPPTTVSEKFQKESNRSRPNSGHSLPTNPLSISDANLDHPSPNSSRSKSRHSTLTPISNADLNVSIHSKLRTPNVADQNENPLPDYFIESPRIDSPVLDSRCDTPEPPEDENISCESPISVLTERNSSLSAHSFMSEAKRKLSFHSRTSNRESTKSTSYKVSKSSSSKTPSQSHRSLDGDEDRICSIPSPQIHVNSFHGDNRTPSESRYSSSIGIRNNSILH